MNSANTPTATIEPITTKRMKVSFEFIESVACGDAPCGCHEGAHVNQHPAAVRSFCRGIMQSRRLIMTATGP